MSAQTPYIQPGTVGAFPSFLLLMVIVLTTIGILAHAVFL